MNQPTWQLTVKDNGVVDIPDDLWETLRRKTGRKSKKRRHVKKAVRKLMIKLLTEYLDK